MRRSMTSTGILSEFQRESSVDNSNRAIPILMMAWYLKKVMATLSTMKVTSTRSMRLALTLSGSRL